MESGETVRTQQHIAAGSMPGGRRSTVGPKTRSRLLSLSAAGVLLFVFALIDPLQSESLQTGVSAVADTAVDSDGDGTPDLLEFNGDANANGIPDVLDPLEPMNPASPAAGNETGIGWMGQLGIAMSLLAGVILVRRSDGWNHRPKFRIQRVDLVEAGDARPVWLRSGR